VKIHLAHLVSHLKDTKEIKGTNELAAFNVVKRDNFLSQILKTIVLVEKNKQVKIKSHK
jgi:hypothetical protein